MVAIRRSRSSGTVIALVIFVILTFLSAGAAIWYAMSEESATQRLKENQTAFNDSVGQKFRDQGWNLPKAQEPGILDVQYDSTSYGAVATKLEEAATFEKMGNVTGWKSPSAVQDLLKQSPLAQDRETTYDSASGLLNAYENEYQGLKQQVATLNQKVASLQQQLQTKEQTLNDVQSELRDKLNTVTQEYQQKMKKRNQEFQALSDAHEAQRQETQKWRQQYEQAVDKREQRVAELQKDVKEWQNMYTRLRDKRTEEKLQPTGEVLAVKDSYDFIVVGGGEDIGRKRDQRLVIYSESVTGERTRKGSAVVTDVYDHTASASILMRELEEAEISQGDFVVTEASWEKFQNKESGEQVTSR